MSLARKRLRIPADWEVHQACVMSWAVPLEWGDWRRPVLDELATIVQTISEFEKVIVLAPSQQVSEATARLAGGRVEIVEAPVEDIWMRDCAPTFAISEKEVVAIDWNPLGWAGKMTSSLPEPGGSFGSRLADLLEVDYLRAPFVAEGGAFVTDGQGTLVTSRSCLLHPTRNPPCFGTSRQLLIERELCSLGVEKVIWLEGDSSEPITHGHVDGYVLFASPGHALVESIDDEGIEAPPWREHDIIALQQGHDAKGRALRIDTIAAPRKRHWKFRGRQWAPCYLNAYLANDAVITARFGDPERDEIAREGLQRAFPSRTVQMLRIDHVASGGGGIRCLTQSIPTVAPR